MTVAKRIALLMATSALAATLSGCEALDFLNLPSFGQNQDSASETAAAPRAQVMATAPTAQQQPAPFDLSGAQPMLPQSTLNTQSSAANAALIGSTMGTSPSGFGGLVPGVPTTTTTTATYSYGAQPNPYAPRIPAVANTAAPVTSSLSYQPTVTPMAAPSPYAAPSYQPTVQQGFSVNMTPPTIVRAPSAMPLATGLPTSTVAPVTQSLTTPSQPGTLDPANLSTSTITAIQTALKSRGLYSDTVDGVWGSKSKAAMTAYLATRGESAVSLDTLFSLGVSL